MSVLPIDYYKRVECLRDHLIVKNAFLEQRALELPFYTTFQKIIQKIGLGNYRRTCINIYQNLKTYFNEN